MNWFIINSYGRGSDNENDADDNMNATCGVNLGGCCHLWMTRRTKSNMLQDATSPYRGEEGVHSPHSTVEQLLHNFAMWFT